MFARSFCGEGIPDFYAKAAVGEDASCITPSVDAQLKDLYDELNFCKSIKSRGYTLDANGQPLIPECQTENFPHYYNTPEALTAFSALYYNENGLQDKFIDFWNVTSKRFANNPFVVGFDPINEPYPSNYFKDPNLLNPGEFDRTQLQPMYEQLHQMYIKHSPYAISWFEPNTFLNVIGTQADGGEITGIDKVFKILEKLTTPGAIDESLVPADELEVLNSIRKSCRDGNCESKLGFSKIIKAGFTHPPGGQVGSANHVLNDHSYCC